MGRGLMSHALEAHPMAHRSPLSGLLANRMHQGLGQAPQQTSQAGMPAGQHQQEQHQDEGQPQMQQQQPSPTQRGEIQHTEVQSHPFVETAPTGIAQHEQQKQQSLEGQPQPARTVTSELLDPGPAAPPQTPRLGTDALPHPTNVVNETSSSAPVVEPQEKQFGAIPQVGMPGISDHLDEPPPHHQFAQEDPNPTQPLQMSQSQFTSNAPAYRYQTAGSSTAYTPTFSYNRR